MTAQDILKLEPTASLEKVEKIAEVWDEVVSSIIQEMLAYTKFHMGELHVDLREEMILELAKLTSYLSMKIVASRMHGRIVEDINPQVEREQCFSSKGKQKISATAKNCAERIWLRKYHERWKPKTEAALKNVKNQRGKFVAQPVEDNHFIPKSFIKRYWSEGPFVYRTIKSPARLNQKNKIPVGSWGFRPNLYSDWLETYFGLLEGDAVRPIQMVLNVEPLNRPQREALVGFIVIQRIRNPFFMKSLAQIVTPIVVSEAGLGKAEDEHFMWAVYEALYRNNDFYDKLARPIIYSRWVVVHSESPDFVLPDVCNIFGTYENKQYVVMPLTPNDCLIVLPIEIDEPRIVPHYIKASVSMARDVSYILRCAAKEEFLCKSDASFTTVNEEPNRVMQRIISSLSKITADD